jgi:hypothetical protein
MKLNLGSGSFPIEGYENWDQKQGQECGCLRGIEDNSIEEIRASHLLEHFSHREVGAVLGEWVRVLKPGGVLQVAVPNFEWVARAYLAGEPVNVQGIVMGGHVDDLDRHGTIFDEEELTRALRTAGLWDIRTWQSAISDCASLPCSLNLQGRKKGPVPALKIAGAMSVPRLGFQDNFFCWADALLPLDILPTKYDGAFWGQCLERVMMDQLDADWILAVDYDSVFTRQTVEDLIRLASLHPEADAIAALQLRRGGNTPLATVKGPDGQLVGRLSFEELKRDLLQVSTAHFGLTLIRTAALRKVPHPWFLGVPNSQGLWDDGKVDDDTYFWQAWEKAGNTIYLAPHVVVAHGQFLLTWPGHDMQPVHQHPADFWEKGLPEGVWR